MNTSMIDEQIDALRPTLAFASQLHRWLRWLGVVGAVLAVVLWHPIPLMFAVFFVIVAWAERGTGSRIVSAIKAYDHRTPTNGEATIQLLSGSDDHRYQATVRESGQAEWQFEFIPQGWKPKEQLYPAMVWRNPGDGRPLLVTVGDGILIPRRDAEMADPGNGDDEARS